MTRGVLHLVVGPSGAGKDTLIDAVRPLRPDILFARRSITRPAGAGGEDHLAVDEATFSATAAAGGYALWWRANGLGYGVGPEVEAALAAGRHVVMNGSRGMVEAARARFRPLRVLFVTAAPETLALRLAERGRESAAEIAGRLDRAALKAPTGPDVLRIDNSGALEAARRAMLGALAA